MTNFTRISEADLYPAVAAYLADAGGQAPISAVRRALPRYIQLSPADRTPSSTRPGEEFWEQLLRNIVCHRDCEGNPIKEGLLRYSKRRLILARGPQGNLFDG